MLVFDFMATQGRIFLGRPKERKVFTKLCQHPIFLAQSLHLMEAWKNFVTQLVGKPRPELRSLVFFPMYVDTDLFEQLAQFCPIKWKLYWKELRLDLFTAIFTGP